MQTAPTTTAADARNVFNVHDRRVVQPLDSTFRSTIIAHQQKKIHRNFRRINYFYKLLIFTIYYAIIFARHNFINSNGIVLLREPCDGFEDCDNKQFLHAWYDVSKKYQTHKYVRISDGEVVTEGDFKKNCEIVVEKKTPEYKVPDFI